MCYSRHIIGPREGALDVGGVILPDTVGWGELVLIIDTQVNGSQWSLGEGC